ncbi:MAG: RNA methyltransferase [Planctomycetes bacterium]|nr:RNA methyltransferase [Planctomycetota bacterium]
MGRRETGLITSVQNPRIKAAARLRDSRARRKAGRFLIDGAREISRAIGAGVTVHEAFICPELCDSPERQEAARLAEESAAETFHVTPAVFAKLAFGDREEGTVLVAATPQRTLADLQLPANPLIAVLEGVEKPGNFGAVLRTADAAGVSAVIAADGSHDVYNPNVIRASLGAVFTLPVCAADSSTTLDRLRSQRIAIYAARVGAGRLYTDADFRGPAAIILGSEAHGLSEVWRGDDITSIELPMHGVVDSLNVSAAAAVLVYEALRQRTAAE